MKLIESLEEIADENLAVTIGNFDGVHIGHQYVLKAIKEKISDDTKLVVISFTPHPSIVLSPRKDFLINEAKDKYELLENAETDYYYEIPFTRDLSTLTGNEFLTKYLSSKSHKIRFFLGYDFSFGANKKDGVNSIEKFCKERNYSFEVLDKKSVKELSVSSSKIRNLIKEGDVKQANRLLGRDFYLSGTIVKGEGRGKQIGFPTANMQYSNLQITPSKGVYYSSVLYKNGMYKSITNIGVKPTFESDAEITVETYILDFDKDIYGETFKLYFHSKLRDEKRFDSVNDLIEQISRDVASRRKCD
ncbi:MAG: riboflavin biosynthesis protein RibF [Halobacteriovorax sp.]|nr:riboflavin biosynthesis protein RibF [Halobacteriovorax sp.]